jgi:hypothetical protein
MLVQALEQRQRFYEGNLTLVAEEDGDLVAEASAPPMRQNVRGTVYPMAGVAGVATWAAGEPVAATTYRITGFGGVMARLRAQHKRGLG